MWPRRRGELGRNNPVFLHSHLLPVDRQHWNPEGALVGVSLLGHRVEQMSIEGISRVAIR